MKEQIDELMQQWKPVDVSKLPQRLALNSITVLQELYQPRTYADRSTGVSDERHAKELTRTLKQVGDLDPIQIIPIGESYVMLDGHHRLQAYKQEGRQDVPVVYFTGNPKEALLEAGAENIKERLAVTPADKTQRAWQLVTSSLEYSKKDIVKSTQAADGTVAEMRRVLKWFEEQGVEPSERWSTARWKFKQGDVNEQRPEFDYEAMLEEKANWTAMALRKRFHRITTHDEALIFARGITGFCSGHFLPMIARELMKEAGLWDRFLEEAAEELKANQEMEF